MKIEVNFTELEQTFDVNMGEIVMVTLLDGDEVEY